MIIAHAPRPPAGVQPAFQRAEQAQPIGPADLRLRRPLGVRHQAEHVAALVDDPGDPAQRAVRVGLRRSPSVGIGVAQDDAARASSSSSVVGSA